MLLYIGNENIQAEEGTSGFEFLRTEYSSRAASMGRAFVAMRGDINGLYHNPSGMAFFDQNQFVVNWRLVNQKAGEIARLDDRVCRASHKLSVS